MNQGIIWRRGQFLKFYARMKIRVGGKDTLDIQAGDEFEYDGSIVKYAGAEFQQLGLRGAINQGWATLDADSQLRVSPVLPSRDIAKSQTKNTDLSRVQRTKAAQLETDHLDEETVLQVSDRRPGANSTPNAEPRRLTSENNRRTSTAGQRALGVTESDLDQQDGMTVGRVRSAAKIKVDDITREGDLAKQIENRPLGRPEIFAPRKRVIEREGVTITTNVGDVDRSISVAPDDEGVTVAKVRKSKPAGNADGVEVHDTSNVRTKKNGAAKPVPVVKTIPKNVSLKHKVALNYYAEFPLDWNFMAPIKDRVSLMKKQSKNPLFLKALYAAEGEQMKKVIEKQFPALFA